MKEIVKSKDAPAAIGPYSQAIREKGGAMIFCSGQIPLDPQSMKIVGESAADQCRQVMENISALLKASGAELSQVVKATIYLTDMNDFGAVNEVYGEFFKVDPPARACVEVSRLPKDVKVEIDVIAMV